MKIIHAVHLWGNSPRHKDAQRTWGRLYFQGMRDGHCTGYPRDAHKVTGDPRSLPFFKDVIAIAREQSKELDDYVVLWTNDDIGLESGIFDWVRDFVVPAGAMSMRRNEAGHIGRDLFAFTNKWLDAHLDEIPDFIQGAPCFDLVIAALIRKHHGIQSDLENMKLDIMPSESPHRLAKHEYHVSYWAGALEHKYPANLWNKKLASEWCKNNMPSLKL